MKNKYRMYWNDIAGDYQGDTYISTDDFHFGPMIPGNKKLKLLPAYLKDLKCLEIACGAAQNSIYLAKKGALCAAFDIAEMQLAVALDLIRMEKVSIQLYRFSMDSKWVQIKGKFDFIHSMYGLCFSKNPAKVVKQASAHLKKGGVFLFSLEHPLAACEKLILEDEGGAFVSDYFNLSPEVRYDEDGNELIRSSVYTNEEVSQWVSKAGLVIERIVEPRPVAHEEFDDIPYISDAWQEAVTGFEGIPTTVIYLCRKI